MSIYGYLNTSSEDYAKLSKFSLPSKIEVMPLATIGTTFEPEIMKYVLDTYF